MASNVSIISASWADVDSQVMSLSGSNDISRGGSLLFAYNDQNAWFPNPTNSTLLISWLTPRFTLQSGGYIFVSNDGVHTINVATTVPNNTVPYGANNPDRNAIISNTDFDTQWRLRVIAQPGNTNATDSVVTMTVYGLNENGHAFHSDYNLGNMLFQTYDDQDSDNFESIQSNNSQFTSDNIVNFASQGTAYQLPIELPDSTTKYVQRIGYFQFNGSTKIRYIGLRIDIEDPNTSTRFHKIELIPINRSVGASPIANRILRPHAADHPYSKCGWGVHTYLAISVPPTGEMVELANIKNSTAKKNPDNQSAFTDQYNDEVGEDHWPWSISNVAGTTPSTATGATKGVPPMVNMTNNSEPGGNGTNSGTITVSGNTVHINYSNANLKYNNYGWKRLEEPYEPNVQYSQRYLYTETSGMSATAGASGPHNIPFIFHTQTIYLKDFTGHETLSFYYHARGSNIGTLQVLAWNAHGAFRHPDYDQEYNDFLPPAATLLSIRFWDGTAIQGTDDVTTQIGPGQKHTTGTQPWYRAEVELSNLPKKNASGEEIPYKFVFHYRKNGTSYNGDFCVNNIRITGLNEPGVISPGPGGDDGSPL